MVRTPDKVSVRCACGDTHEFSRQHAGRIARCPKLNRRFRVPDCDGTAAFIDEARPPASSNEAAPPETQANSPSVGMGGRLVKRVTDLYDAHRQKRELHQQTHCRCPHCNAENLTADFMCAKCGCPLHDQQQAFLFMEKRRQEAHEVKLARGGGAHPPATPPRLEHGHVSQAPSVNVHMPRRTSSLGVVSLILGVVAFLLCWIPLVGMLSIPLSALGLLLGAIGLLVALMRRGSGIGYPIGGGAVSGLALAIGIAQVAAVGSAVSGVAEAMDESHRQQTRTNQEVVASASPGGSQRPRTARDSGGPRPTKPPAPAEAEHKRPQQAEAQATIPNDVTYTIIKKYVLRSIKRSLDVRLNRKVSEDVLRAIALQLKDSDPNTYDRTFICYYLPGMIVDAGAWATTHFNPNLEVRILGLTVEEEKALKQQPDDPSREVIGSWLDERLHFGHRVTIFRQNGKVFMENKFPDGSSGKKEIVEKPSGSARKFEKKAGSSVGEFYLIDKKGDLQLWDQDGLISTARKIN
ncbi:MAG: ABC transporter permease [Phycisphaerae bacterium]|nr:ABC transporter permease [Phycisphaerae bacterium]